MTAPVSKIPISSDYTSRDYYALREELIARLRDRIPEWKGTDPADFGVALVEAFAYMGDTINYYIDRIANEAYLGTATQRQSIIELATSLGYTPTGFRAATTTAYFKNVAGTKYSIVTAALTSNVVTLTTGIAHDLEVGDSVTVICSNSAYNGTYTITGVPTDTTLTYALTHTDIPSASVSSSSITTRTAVATIPVGSQFLVEVTSEDETTQLVFTTTTEATVADQTTVSASVIHGQWATTVSGNDPVYGEWIGTSNGLPDQSFPLIENQVVEGTISLYVQNGDVYEKWTQVQHITDYGPTDAVFTTTLDADNFVYINFGDGVSGAVPSTQSLIKANYLIGGGVAGNVVSVPEINDFEYIPGLIEDEKNAVSANVQIAISDALGGADPESNDNIRYAAPLHFSTQARAVTLADYANLILGVSEIGKAKAVAETPNAVTVFVGPDPDPTDPFQYPGYEADKTTLTAGWLDIKEKALDYVYDKIQIGTTVTIAPPVYVPVYIQVQYTKLPQYTDTQIEDGLKLALVTKYSYANSDFGAVMYAEDVEYTLRQVDGVQSLQVKELYLSGGSGRQVLVGEPNQIFVFEEANIDLRSSTALTGLSFSLGTLSPSFVSTVLNYVLTVPNGTTSITATPTKDAAAATIKVNGTTVTSGSPSGSISTPVGITPITVVVTGDDGVSTRTYAVTATRAS